MFSLRLPARFATPRPRGLLLLALLTAACSTDHIVSVDGGNGGRRITARVGDIVDIRLWAGALGAYASPPTVSESAVVFVDVVVDAGSNGFVSPGGPTQRFRFQAKSRGIAVVTFSPLQNAPVVIDTIIVQ